MRPIRTVPALLVAIGAALLFALPAGAADRVYQWKDAQGVTHYSDSPPPKGRYSDREIKATAATQAATAAPAAGPPAEDAQCALARLNLERLQGDAVVGLDADGDGQPDAPLSDEGRARQVEIAQAAIRVRCRPAAP